MCWSPSQTQIYGIYGHVFCLISLFLSNKQLHVVLNDTYSQECPTKAGLPESSTLGHSLFRLYIDELPDNIIHNTAIYADDITPFS